MKQKILSLFLSTLLIVMLLGSVGAEAAMHDGKLRANPWEDSGIPSSFTSNGSAVKYMDFLVPYDCTVEEVGGYSRALFRKANNTDLSKSYEDIGGLEYTHDIFYESDKIKNLYFGQTYVQEFPAATALSKFKNSGSSYHEWWVDDVSLDSLKNGGKAKLHCKVGSRTYDGSDSDGYLAWDADLSCLYFVVRGVKFFPGCVGENTYKLGAALAKDPASGITTEFFDYKEGTDQIVDVYLVDGTCVHLVQFDTFGTGHSVGTGYIGVNGKLGEVCKSVTELSSEVASKNSKFSKIWTSTERTDYSGPNLGTQSNPRYKWAFGFMHPVGDSKYSDGDGSWRTDKLYWYYDSDAMAKEPTKNIDDGVWKLYVQDGCTFGCTPMENTFQYALSVHANGYYINETVGGGDTWMKGLHGWTACFKGDTDGLDKRYAVTRIYNLTFEEFMLGDGDIVPGYEGLNGFTQTDAQFTGGAGTSGGQGAPLTQAQRDSYVKTLAAEWKTINFVIERDLSDLFVTEDSLVQKDRTRLEEWSELAKEDDTAISVLRLIVQIVGIVVLIWGILFYLAYWMDTLNTFFEFSFVSVLTMGKLVATNDDNSSDKNTVTHKKALITLIITTAFAVSLISGLIYKFLIWLIMGIKSLLG